MFAVFWIFFGITFFAMYLGTITSVMTKNLYEQPEFEVAGKRVIGLFIPIKFSLLICLCLCLSRYILDVLKIQVELRCFIV